MGYLVNITPARAIMMAHWPLVKPPLERCLLTRGANTVDRNQFKMPDCPESIDQLVETVEELTVGEVWVHDEEQIRYWIGRNTGHTQFSGLDKVSEVGRTGRRRRTAPRTPAIGRRRVESACNFFVRGTHRADTWQASRLYAPSMGAWMTRAKYLAQNGGEREGAEFRRTHRRTHTTYARHNE